MDEGYGLSTSDSSDENYEPKQSNSSDEESSFCGLDEAQKAEIYSEIQELEQEAIEFDAIQQATKQKKAKPKASTERANHASFAIPLRVAGSNPLPKAFSEIQRLPLPAHTSKFVTESIKAVTRILAGCDTNDVNQEPRCLGGACTTRRSLHLQRKCFEVCGHDLSDPGPKSLCLPDDDVCTAVSRGSFTDSTQARSASTTNCTRTMVDTFWRERPNGKQNHQQKAKAQTQ